MTSQARYEPLAAALLARLPVTADAGRAGALAELLNDHLQFPNLYAFYAEFGAGPVLSVDWARGPTIAQMRTVLAELREPWRPYRASCAATWSRLVESVLTPLGLSISAEMDLVFWKDLAQPFVPTPISPWLLPLCGRPLLEMLDAVGAGEALPPFHPDEAATWLASDLPEVRLAGLRLLSQIEPTSGRASPALAIISGSA